MLVLDQTFAVNEKIVSGVVGYESVVYCLNKVCTAFVDEGKPIFEFDSPLGVSALDSLLCLEVQSLSYGVQIRTVISIGFLDCAGIYLGKKVVDSPIRENAAGEGIVHED